MWYNAYNGRYGVITDANGLVYMRARYYSPDMRRFVNADIVAGKLNNSVTLNRYAYANANPAMFVDPMGLFGFFTAVAAVSAVVGLCMLMGGSSKQEETTSSDSVSTSGTSSAPSNSSQKKEPSPKVYTKEQAKNAVLAGIETPSDSVRDIKPNQSFSDDEPTYAPNPNKKKSSTSNTTTTPRDYEKEKIIALNEWAEHDMVDNALSGVGYALDLTLPIAETAIIKSMRNAPCPNNIGIGTYMKMLDADEAFIRKGVKYTGYGLTAVSTIISTGMGVEQNIKNGESAGEIWSDAAIDIGGGAYCIGTASVCA